MHIRAGTLALLVVVSLVGMATVPAAGTQQAEGESYAGANVQFETTGDTVANYAVNDNVVVESVAVQSADEARSQAGVGASAGLETASEFRGAGLQIASQTRAGATVSIDSGAEMEAHDNHRGVFQVRATDDDQIVRVNVSSDSAAESEGDKRVVVTKNDGSQGTFIVVGDGEVVVDEEGNVTADIEQGSELVYRQYDDERSESDEEAERMIESGVATAEVYVQQSQDEGEETVVDAVEYGQDTSVEVVTRSRSTVEMTVERTESDGKVVLTSVSETAFENAEDTEVFVDGEAATRADSYSEVEMSAMEGDEPRYYVTQSASTEAAVDVVVGIDHFSERNVELTSGETDETTPAEDDETTPDADADADGTGFGALIALAALAAALVAMRRR